MSPIELFKNDHHTCLMYTDLVDEDGQAVQANSERTFAATLRQMRMQRAAELLQQPRLRSLNVAQIGERCGYPSPAHFGRAFALEYGLSPAAWRRAELHGRGAERD